MNSEIFANNAWHNCEISYPHTEPAIKVPGLMGTESWQKGSYSEYNCKITLSARGPIIPPAIYPIKLSGKDMNVEVKISKASELWGNIL